MAQILNLNHCNFHGTEDLTQKTETSPTAYVFKNILSLGKWLNLGRCSYQGLLADMCFSTDWKYILTLLQKGKYLILQSLSIKFVMLTINSWLFFPQKVLFYKLQS